MKWYSIKLLFETTVKGNPRNKDRFYKDCDFFEERIITVKAENEDEAFAKAENFAKEDNITYENKYSQAVTTKYYDIIDVTELYGEIEDGTVLFSSIYTKAKDMDMNSLIDRKYISADDEDMTVLRQK